MASRNPTRTTTNEYLDLVRVIKAEVARQREDLDRVLGMFKEPALHRERSIQLHMLRSLVGRRKGWRENATRIDRLLLDAERLALELEG